MRRGRNLSIAQYATSVQHIGLPTKDMGASIQFYTGLGFENIYETRNDGARVVFLKLQNLVIEIWEAAATGVSGSIDHIAIDVTAIEEVFRIVTASGLIAIEGKVCWLPFWERGVRFFTVSGPNAEKIEFIQKL
jgi:lactoylglutathione lyase